MAGAAHRMPVGREGRLEGGLGLGLLRLALLRIGLAPRRQPEEQPAQLHHGGSVGGPRAEQRLRLGVLAQPQQQWRLQMARVDTVLGIEREALGEDTLRLGVAPQLEPFDTAEGRQSGMRAGGV